jgi:hypothetical protein
VVRQQRNDILPRRRVLRVPVSAREHRKGCVLAERHNRTVRAARQDKAAAPVERLDKVRDPVVRHRVSRSAPAVAAHQVDVTTKLRSAVSARERVYRRPNQENRSTRANLQRVAVVR